MKDGVGKLFVNLQCWSQVHRICGEILPALWQTLYFVVPRSVSFGSLQRSKISNSGVARLNN